MIMVDNMALASIDYPTTFFKNTVFVCIAVIEQLILDTDAGKHS
jgi:hypothetical protein